MGDADVSNAKWRYVEVGRIVLFTTGELEGRLAAISEIIDHKRVLVDGPSSDPKKVVPRHAAALAHLTLTHLTLPKLVRASGTGALKKHWEKEEVENKWNASSWAKSRAQGARRRELTDFERFKVMRLRKQMRFEVRRDVAKARAAKA